MNTSHALNYARTAPGGWWQWDDDGGAVVWHDGTTIALRPELKAILDLLAPAGLPPFAAVVLPLAVLRGKIPVVSPADTGAPMPAERGQLLLALKARWQTESIERLRLLTELAPRLGRRPVEKALLLEAILERVPRVGGAEAAEIAQSFDLPCSVAALNGAPPEAAAENEHALTRVIDGLRPFTADSLLARIRTGLEALPEAGPELELPREERARRLFEALRNDEELGGVAQVARDLMAAIQLPRLLVEPDELALGGAADLTNRGALDRLLLSELAHDDLTLATRVALNEALYLRREPPAHRPERSLAVLLDTGLRMWGVPRVLGIAAALALLARRDGHGDAQVWRACGAAVVAADLLTRNGLGEQLATMTTELNPGAAIPAWREALAECGEVDAVLVTHRDALADHVFQARLADAAFARGFLLLIERDGLVELHALPWGSPRPLAQARIDVAKLFPRTRAKPTSLPLGGPDLSALPAIFRERPFPLLLPVNAKVQRSEKHGGGGLCVTEDGRLFAWDGPLRGARQLAADLPAGRTEWLGVDEAGDTIVVKGRAGDGRSSVTIVPSSGGQARCVRFTGPASIPAVLLQGRMMMLVLHTRVALVDLDSAEVVSETQFPAGTTWVNGRYFCGPDGPRFVSCEGTAVTWDRLLSGRELRRADIVTIVDHEGVGAWMLCRDGRLLGPTGNEVLKTGFALNDAIPTPTSAGILLHRYLAKEHYLLQIKPTAVLRVNEFQAKAHQSARALPVPARSLLTKLNGATISREHGLRLFNRNGRLHEFSYSPARGLRLIATTGPHVEPVVQFSAISSPRSIGCSLRVAEWPSGSRAWLDSRGLLHLRSHDPAVPEITLVLAVDAPLAGWCSNSIACGPAFFRDDSRKDEPGRVRDALKAFWSRAC